ncbi:class I adenylate-forming enzyme family protein [Hyphomonas sp.]|uniref:class I adenylate-forming enzyme family protein n=1 Tax=Hyphomonas sp. TaxID=87 RepID=UPI0025BFC9B2|nr:class I adenylate-forming enzyme family protein [Hyphomonas sp.]
MMETAKNIYDVLRWRVESAPNGEAVLQDSLRLTNQDLAGRIDTVATFLLASGIRKGDRVATLAPPCLDFWITFLAATSIGAIWQGLNPAYKRNEYAYLLADASPSLIFAHTDFDGRNYFEELEAISDGSAQLVPLYAEALGTGDTRLELSSSLPEGSLKSARAAVDPEDIAVIVYTSGTTGQPKGAMLSHRAVVQTALSNIAWMPTEGLSATLCAAPINHVGGLNNVCFTVFAAGGRIIFFPRVDRSAISVLNAREQPTYLVGSPTAWAMMIAAGMDFSAASFFKLIVFGGAASTIAQLEHVRKTGARMSSVYGQTETTGMMTYTEEDAGLDVMSETIGKPIRGNEIRIAAPDGAPIAVGETGEIQVRGVSVMSGYWNKPDASKEAFTADGWLKTGDLGIQRLDGNIVFAGRLKEMFKSGGYNVYPVEVELAICEHPDVMEASVIEVPHDTFQEVGHAFLVLRPGSSLAGDDLKAFLKDRIAGYKIPKSWQILEAFPRLPNGKTDKRGLRAAYQPAG